MPSSPVSQGVLGRRMDDGDFERLSELVARRAGNVRLSERRATVVGRVEQLARRLGRGDAGSLVRALGRRGDPELEGQVVEAALNGETLFFRDVRLFELLRLEVLPPLLARRRDDRTLRLWSGACSTGQEVYSLLMLLAEHFPETDDWEVEVVATDLSANRLARAEAGRFTQMEVNRGLPARYLVRYLEQEAGGYRVSAALRDRVRFERLNLLDPWPTWRRMDMILLRHVLIYFDDAGRRSVLERACDLLRHPGTLILGGSETTAALPGRFVNASPRVGGCFRLDPCTAAPAVVPPPHLAARSGPHRG